MSRAFSTTARNLLKFIWKGTESNPKYEGFLIESVSKNTKLQDADIVQIEGQEHTSKADPASRVFGKIFRDGTRLTSVHAYHDGRVIYSKEEYNESQQ